MLSGLDPVKSVFAFVLMGCLVLFFGCTGDKTVAGPSSTPTPASAPASKPALVQPRPKESQASVPVTVNDLIFKNSSSIQVLSTNDFKDLYKDANYLDIFGVPPVHMVSQEIKFGQSKGAVIFFAFAGADMASQAASKVKQTPNKRPRTILCAGSVVVLIQSSDSSREFVNAVQADFQKRVANIQ